MAQNTIGRGLKFPGQCLGIRVNQAGVGLETHAAAGVVGARALKVVELPRDNSGHKNAPYISPAIACWRQVDDFGRLAIVDIIVQQQPHFRRVAAKHDELDTMVVNYRPVRQHVCELKLWMCMAHLH